MRTAISFGNYHFALLSFIFVAELALISISGAEAQDSKAEPVFELIRDTDAGICLNYTIRIFEDGKVQYEGFQGGREMVSRESQISTADVVGLKREFHDAKYFEIRTLKYHSSGAAILDCKLDWDILKKNSAYAEQCKTADEVVLNSRIIGGQSGDKVTYRDGGVSRQLSKFRVAYQEFHVVTRLQFRIDQVTNSMQWTGPNKCSRPD